MLINIKVSKFQDYSASLHMYLQYFNDKEISENNYGNLQTARYNTKHKPNGL